MCSFLTIAILYARFIKITTSVNSIPSFVKVCKQTDPDLDNCIINTLNQLQPYLAKGIPELKIFPLDPLKIPKLDLRSNNFEANVTEVEIRRWTNFEIKHFHMDLNHNQLDINIRIPKFEEEGECKMQDQLLTVNLQTAGHYTKTYTNVDIGVRAKAKRVKKKRGEHLDFNDIDLQVRIEDGKINFENLFEGNQQLTDQANLFLNENLQTLLSDFRAIVTDIFKRLFLQIINVFGTFSVNKLFPK